MDETDRLFMQGRANPTMFGSPIRSSAGEVPDQERIEEAAHLLGRSVFFLDTEGYECEIIGAAISEAGDIAFVETRAKEVESNQYGVGYRYIDTSIRVHLVDASGRHASADIQSYNPFFGCDVRFFEWVGGSVVLIYREKHWTFACRFGDIWPPRFVKIAHNWIINGNELGYIGYKEEMVQRVSFPELDALDPIPVDESDRVGLLPSKRK